jgi:competence protein ComEC
MTCCALSFFLGVLVSSLLLINISLILVCVLLSLTVVFINRRSSFNLKASVLLLIFLLGVLDYRIASQFKSRLDRFDGKTAVYQCMIVDRPVDKGSYIQYKAKCRTVICGDKVFNYKDKVFIKVFGSTSFKYGDLIKVEGICENIGLPRNPGDFDYRAYYRSKGISKVINAESIDLIKENSAGILASSLYLSREKVRAIIYSALPREEASILMGIITGDKSDIDEETRNDYIEAGLSHILSVSGLHVGFLMLLLTQVLKPFKPSKKTEGIIVSGVILYYILLIGAPLPSVRAFIMLLVLIAGKLIGRQYHLLSSVSFALLVILIFKPLSIHDTGFIISFSSMYSIAFLFEPVNNKLRRIPAILRSSLALSVSVWLGLAPVLVHYFNYLSFVSIVVNVAAVPLSFVITAAGFVGVLTGVFFNKLAIYIFSVDYYFIKLLSFITHEASSLKLAGVHIPSLPLYVYALYYIAVLAIPAAVYPYLKIYKRRFIASYLLLIAVSLMVYNFPSREMKVIFFDVGQGDSSCIITPDKKTVLIDGGGMSRNSNYYYDVGGKITLPALLHQGIWSIDTIIVSHFHDDHMEGLLKVIEVYPVNKLVIPEVSAGAELISPNGKQLLNLCREKGINVYRIGKGDSIKLGKNGELDFYMPDKVSGYSTQDENNNSLVCRLRYRKFTLLYTGDIGSIVEGELLKDQIDSVVLKVPHHGSKYSSSKSFIEAVSPKVSIISVGKNNFGHPSQETIERLNSAGSMVYRTDESGAVIIKTDGINMKLTTMK